MLKLLLSFKQAPLDNALMKFCNADNRCLLLCAVTPLTYQLLPSEIKPEIVTSLKQIGAGGRTVLVWEKCQRVYWRRSCPFSFSYTATCIVTSPTQPNPIQSPSYTIAYIINVSTCRDFDFSLLPMTFPVPNRCFLLSNHALRRLRHEKGGGRSQVAREDGKGR